MRAIHHELVVYLNNTEFEVNIDFMATDSHKSKLIHDALDQVKDAEEALILWAAIPDCGLDQTNPLHKRTDVYDVYRHRKLECRQTAAWIEQKYELALSLFDGNNDFFGWFQKFVARVVTNATGDLETSLYVQALMTHVEQRAGNVSNNAPPANQDTPTLRGVATELGTLYNKFGELQRSQRFFGSIKAIQEALANNHLDCSKCRIDRGLDELTLLSQCGHLVCDSCLSVDGEVCTEGKCLAENYYHDKIPVAKFFPGGNQVADNSQKIPELVKLINNIIASKEKVLVFVQFRKLLRRVQEALKAEGISFVDLDNYSASSTVIADFANDLSPGVMILNIGDASAAGR
jgi:hypothetical protein